MCPVWNISWQQIGMCLHLSNIAVKFYCWLKNWSPWVDKLILIEYLTDMEADIKFNIIAKNCFYYNRTCCGHHPNWWLIVTVLTFSIRTDTFVWDDMGPLKAAHKYIIANNGSEIIDAKQMLQSVKTFQHDQALLHDESRALTHATGCCSTLMLKPHKLDRHGRHWFSSITRRDSYNS